MNELNAGAVAGDPLTERPGDTCNPVVPQFSREYDVADASNQPGVKGSGLPAEFMRVSRCRSRAYSNAECGTQSAQPADESSAGGHGAECRAVQNRHKARLAGTYNLGWSSYSVLLERPLIASSYCVH